MPSLDTAFSALADPTRRAILARLASGETTVMELAEPFDMTQPAISRHLKVLEGAGLIVRRVEGTKRARRNRGDRSLARDAARSLGTKLRPAGRRAGRHEELAPKDMR